MKSIDQWLDEYTVSHQNKTNKMIHWVCVPIIFITIIGLLSIIPFDFIKQYFPEGYQQYIHVGSLLIVFGMFFYLRLSVPLALGMAGISLLILYLIATVNTGFGSPITIYFGFFVLAWIGQFVGHKIEGKKPSFFKDLQFLMIGPIWLLSFVYAKWNINYH